MPFITAECQSSLGLQLHFIKLKGEAGPLTFVGNSNVNNQAGGKCTFLADCFHTEIVLLNEILEIGCIQIIPL